jgi:hypothetical protein
VCRYHNAEILDSFDDGYFCPHCERIYDKSDCEISTFYKSKTRIPRPVNYIFDRGYALLIGIANYENEYLILDHTLDDIRNFREQLLSSGYLNSKIYPHCSDLTKDQIDDGFDWISDRCKRDKGKNTALIYFSGHGFHTYGLDEGEYLCPVNFDLKEIEKTAISTIEFANAIKAIPAEHVIVLLDACHSGGFSKAFNKGFSENGSGLKYGLSKAGYQHLFQENKVVIFASCNPDEKSLESDVYQGGLFTHYLIEGMRNAQKQIWTKPLIEYVKEKVSGENPEQNPVAYNQIDFCIGYVK